jgi:hypothetical protein
MLLTSAVVRDLAPATKPYEVRDDRLRGILVRVQPSGHKAYYVEYARGRRVALGRADVIAPSITRDKAKRSSPRPSREKIRAPSAGRTGRTRSDPS